MSSTDLTSILLLALFPSWIKAVACIAVALLVRPRASGIVVAAVVGVAADSVELGLSAFLGQFREPALYVAATLALSALTGVAWWCVGRAGVAFGRLIYETVQVPRTLPGGATLQPARSSPARSLPQRAPDR
jgi:hypothetical protein